MRIKSIEDLDIVNALMEYKTVKKASEALNISESTINKRKKDPCFKALFDEVLKKQYRATTEALESNIVKAVDTINEIMTDRNVSPQIRLNACETMLRNALKYSERTDVLERLEEIEKQLNHE